MWAKMNEHRKTRWGRKWPPPLPWQRSETRGRLRSARSLCCADVTSSTAVEAAAAAAAAHKTKAEGTFQHQLQSHENLSFFLDRSVNSRKTFFFPCVSVWKIPASFIIKDCFESISMSFNSNNKKPAAFSVKHPPFFFTTY